MAVRIGEIRTLAGLEALRPAWTELWQRAPVGTAFQHPAWLIPWWRHIGDGELIALTAHQDGRLVGLLPLFVLSERGANKLLLLGTGNTDYCDGVFEPDADRIVPAMLDHLTRVEPAWDVCDLGPLPQGSPLLAAPTLWGGPARCRQGEVCPVLPLPEDEVTLLGRLPRRMRQNLSYYRKRAEKTGALRFEQAAPATLRELLDAFLALHGTRWASVGQSGVLSDEAVRTFHQQAAPGLLEAGLLRLYALRVDEQIVAAIYGLLAKDRFLLYLTAFDPAHRDLSPGTLILGEAVARAVREHARTFDFLRGSERYKYHWGAHDEPTHVVQLSPAVHSPSSCTLDHARA